MKMLFINPSNFEFYPIQIGALSAYLKRNNHETSLLNLIIPAKLKESHFKQIEKKMEEVKPHVIGFSVYEMTFFWVKEIATFIKRKYGTTIIAGGYYPTLVPEDVISENSIDLVCRGEGENALTELLNMMLRGEERTNISNLWIKKNGKIYKNNIRPLMEDLNDLPYPDREVLDYQSHLDSIAERGQRVSKFIVSRGCPYICTYCSNKYFKQLYSNKDKYVRIRTVDNVLDEISNVVKKYNFEYIGFHDDNLLLFNDWLKEFCVKYPKVIKKPFYCSSRVENCTNEKMSMLKQAGCYMLLFGIESGDEEYRKTVQKRYMSNKKIIDVFRNARRLKIMTWSFNMVGMPYETRSKMLKTVLLNWRIAPDFAMTAIYYPLKGTEMGDMCYKNGWVDLNKKNRVGSYASDSILKHPKISCFEMRLAKYFTIFTALRSRNKFIFIVLFDRIIKKFRKGI